ncbi:petJ [Symbiodinium sp. CCMP2592]|nr:petJ [Symbiodinium sp. CCMP2592]
MPRVSIACAASLLLCGACFVVPISLNSTPRTKSGVVVELPVQNQTPESTSWAFLALGGALGLLIAAAAARPACAADLENREAVLNSSCTACHAQGSNFVLEKINGDALVEYRKHDVQATIARVTDGKSALPSVGQKLRLDNFEDVASYVYAKADKW